MTGKDARLIATFMVCICWWGCRPAGSVPVRLRGKLSSRMTRSTFQTPPATLALDMDLDGENVQLNMTRNTDQDANIPVYILPSDSSGEVHSRRVYVDEQNLTLYQDPENGAVFGIVHQRNQNGTISVSMEGVIHKNTKLYNLKTRLPADDTGGMAHPMERDGSTHNDVTLDFDVHVYSGLMSQGDIDTVLTPPESKHQTFQQRHKREITQDVNIDVVALADFAAYSLWYSRSNQFMTEAARSQEALNNMYRYYSFVFNGVNMMYKSITTLSYTIHVRLSAIVVATNQDSSLWSESNKRMPVMGSVYYTLDTKTALNSLKSWASTRYNSPTLPAYDHLMGFSGLDLVNETGSNNLLGLAWLDSACKTDGSAASIVEDKEGSFLSIQVAAHELGHSLSSQHDGTPNVCNPDDNFIMAPSSGKPTLEINKLHPWRFSSCSVDYFNNYLTSISSTYQQCVYNILNARSEVPDVTSQMPGQVYNVDDQCRLLYGSGSFACRAMADFVVNIVNDICDFQQLWCSINPTRCQLVNNYVAAGTTCADKRWCVEGQCVYDVTAPSVPDNCPMGDHPTRLSSGKTCAETIAGDRSLCYDTNYQKLCCSSCARIYQPVNGCEYGDRNLTCTPSHCSLRPNVPICCRTCNYSIPTPFPSRTTTIRTTTTIKVTTTIRPTTPPTTRPTTPPTTRPTTTSPKTITITGAPIGRTGAPIAGAWAATASYVHVLVLGVVGMLLNTDLKLAVSSQYR